MGTEITSGELTYGRTRNLGDYNSKKAEVKLAFSVEKNDYAGALTHVTGVAVAACEAILDGKQVPAFLTPASGAATTAAASGKAALEAGAMAAAGAAPAEAAKATKAPKAAKPPKVADAPKAAEEKPAAADDTNADLGDDLMGAPLKEITDADLQAAVMAKNQEIKNPQSIREMIGKFVTHPKGARDIPQNCRQDFLNKLSALKPAAA